MTDAQIESLSGILAFAFLEFKEINPELKLSDHSEDVFKCVEYALVGR